MKKMYYRVVLLLPAVFVLKSSAACITCNRQLQQAIFDSTFYPNLLVMLSPFFVLALIVAGLAIFLKKCTLPARAHKRERPCQTPCR